MGTDYCIPTITTGLLKWAVTSNYRKWKHLDGRVEAVLGTGLGKFILQKGIRKRPNEPNVVKWKGANTRCMLGDAAIYNYSPKAPKYFVSFVTSFLMHCLDICHIDKKSTYLLSVVYTSGIGESSNRDFHFAPPPRWLSYSGYIDHGCQMTTPA
jgi:hypothetical protein